MQTRVSLKNIKNRGEVKKMKVVDVVADVPKTIGGKTVLTGVKPVYDYANGMRSNTVVAYRYIVALPDRAYEHLEVKIPGQQLLSTPNEGDYPLVKFENLELFIYWTPNGYQLGARATGVSIVAAGAAKN